MYEKYKTIKSPKEFWDNWDKETLEILDEPTIERIYLRYVIKCGVFQRDDFKCQNENCSTPDSKLTWHHIKHQRNGGKDTLRNCITICKSCHDRFNKRKEGLTFRGMTYKLHKKELKFDWKVQKKETRLKRKELKKYHGINISLKLLKILIKFLEKEYSDMFEDD